jgi:hypothetical protein
MAKFHIDVRCEIPSGRTKEIHGHRLVLKEDKVWIGPQNGLNPCKDGYVAEAFYIEYPDPERVPVPMGLASQVQDNPPLLNWIYVDKETMELKYGNKSASKEHHVGPWDWTEDEQGVNIDGMETFTAVEEPVSKRWQVYVDKDDDGLSRFVPKGRRKMQVSLKRSLIPGTT